MDVYSRIVRDLKSGRCQMKYGECTGIILYSYDAAYWFTTPMSAYKANVPGADPAQMWRHEITAEFAKAREERELNRGVPQLVIQ